jgi:hypothetical protein
MRIHLLTRLLTVLIVSGCAVVQPAKPDVDHSAHTPPEGAPASPEIEPAPAGGIGVQAFERQMKAMQSMHLRMKAARTPDEREALMSEHMALMKAGMSIMSAMGGMGNAGSPVHQSPEGGRGVNPSAGTTGSATVPLGTGGPGVRGTSGMMNMHKQMEYRMAIMEHMMQMLIDRGERRCSGAPHHAPAAH